MELYGNRVAGTYLVTDLCILPSTIVRVDVRGGAGKKTTTPVIIVGGSLGVVNEGAVSEARKVDTVIK